MGQMVEVYRSFLFRLVLVTGIGAFMLTAYAREGGDLGISKMEIREALAHTPGITLRGRLACGEEIGNTGIGLLENGATYLLTLTGNLNNTVQICRSENRAVKVIGNFEGKSGFRATQVIADSK